MQTEVEITPLLHAGTNLNLSLEIHQHISLKHFFFIT